MTDKNKKDDFPKFLAPALIIGFILFWIIQPIYFFATASKQEIGETLATSLLGGVVLLVLWGILK